MIKKNSKQFQLAFLYMLLLNTFQYNHCSGILTCLKCNVELIDRICRIYRPEKNKKT